MFYLNKETGLKWFIQDEELLKRITNDSKYEVVEDKPKRTRRAPKENKEEV